MNEKNKLMDAVQLLVSFMETVNPQLAKLTRHVVSLARGIGEFLNLSASDLNKIEVAAMIHDIGLLGLPKDLQNKDMKFMSDEQYRLYCEHPAIASITLEKIEELADVAEIVLCHHEYMNGKGFPNGLSDDQIPMGSRVLLAASDYCRIVTTWPRDLRKLIITARKHLAGEDWKNFSYSDDAEAIIEESADKILLKDPEGKYDTQVAKALISVIRKDKNIDPVDFISLDSLKSGMVLLNDLHLKEGRLLLTKGSRLEDTTIQSLQSLAARGLISNQLYVSMPDQNK